MQKHPHGRGEDYKYTALHAIPLETPPRAWGRRDIELYAATGNRNTPTGVGKTADVLHGHAVHRKHPHGRGEDHNNSHMLKM